MLYSDAYIGFKKIIPHYTISPSPSHWPCIEMLAIGIKPLRCTDPRPYPRAARSEARGNALYNRSRLLSSRNTFENKALICAV